MYFNTGSQSRSSNVYVGSGATTCFSMRFLESGAPGSYSVSGGVILPCVDNSSSTTQALAPLVANLTATVALLDELTATVALLNNTLTANIANVANVASSVADHSAMLSCDASGRRLADTLPDPSPPPAAPTAKEVMEDYLARYPEFAATLTDEQRALIDQHGQDFGLPALATGE